MIIISSKKEDRKKLGRISLIRNKNYEMNKGWGIIKSTTTQAYKSSQMCAVKLRPKKFYASLFCISTAEQGKCILLLMNIDRAPKGSKFLRALMYDERCIN